MSERIVPGSCQLVLWHRWETENGPGHSQRDDAMGGLLGVIALATDPGWECEGQTENGPAQTGRGR